jgi:hypothetical protein
MPLATLFTGTTKGDALVNEGVVSDNGSFANDDTHTVVNEDTPPNRGTRMNFNASQKAGKLGN